MAASAPFKLHRSLEHSKTRPEVRQTLNITLSHHSSYNFSFSTTRNYLLERLVIISMPIHKRQQMRPLSTQIEAWVNKKATISSLPQSTHSTLFCISLEHGVGWETSCSTWHGTEFGTKWRHHNSPCNLARWLVKVMYEIRRWAQQHSELRRVADGMAWS